MEHSETIEAQDKAAVETTGRPKGAHARKGRTRGARHLAARSLSLFIGGFSLANALGYALGHSGNQNIWWIDFSWLITWVGSASAAIAFAVECLVGIALVAWAIKPETSRRRRVATIVALAVAAAFAAQNVVGYWILLRHAELWFGLPVPFSAIVVVTLAWLAFVVADPRPLAPDDALSRTGIVVGTLVIALVFPLLQIGFFGSTDYRRTADAAIVLGAQVHADGTPSVALTERLDTAIDLYDQGFVHTLVMSGGQGSDEPVNEADAMRDYAMARGVPESDILLDPNGDSTEATVADTVPLIQRNGWDDVIVTSSFYHMPRIKMMYLLQGVNVLTVPTVGDVAHDGTAQALPREIPAWWAYWAKGTFLG